MALPKGHVNIAPFARVCTWDPRRKTGASASRTEEFRAEDLYTETELISGDSGRYTVPVYEGTGCIGLQWLERRRVRNLAVRGLPASDLTVEAWAGESLWQGQWTTVPARVEEREGLSLVALHPDEEIGRGTQKIRLLFGIQKGSPPEVEIEAYTDTVWELAELELETLEENWEPYTITAYSGAFPGTMGDALQVDWTVPGDQRLAVWHCKESPSKADRTVLRFSGERARFAIAVDDILAGGVLAERFGVFATYKDGPTQIEYHWKHADQKTVLERVREMPEQTVAQALEVTRNPVQDNGPMLLSFPCHNEKFIADRDGLFKYLDLEIRPVLKEGHKGSSRRIQAPDQPIHIVETPVEGGTLEIRTLVFADTYKRTIGLVTYRLKSDGKKPAHVDLAVSQDTVQPLKAFLTIVNGSWRWMRGLRPLFFIQPLGGVEISPCEDDLQFRLSVPAGGEGTCAVYIPVWEGREEDSQYLLDVETATRQYLEAWSEALEEGCGFEIPDKTLQDIVQASLMHCLMAARTSAEGRVEPWIASMAYGPLESEANSILRGMDLWGFKSYTRSSHEFFLEKYNKAGFLTTGYTLMGMGWHLWTLGEHLRWHPHEEWAGEYIPVLKRACEWICAQIEKTGKQRPDGTAMPESGLFPPGVQADWNAFAYHFALSGYFYAGLREAAGILENLGDMEACRYRKAADSLKESILRAYHQTAEISPLVSLSDGRWVYYYPSQTHTPGPIGDFFPGEDGERSWCYDVELGSHHLICQGVLDADDPKSRDMLEHLEDRRFLEGGWFDYPAEMTREDWFNLGGFPKVQPFYARMGEIYTQIGEKKAFLRNSFNSMASLINLENLSFWEHFNNTAAWNKTHETGYFLQHVRWMLLYERDTELLVTAFAPEAWFQLKPGARSAIALENGPTRFGRVSFRMDILDRGRTVEFTLKANWREKPELILVGVPESLQGQSIVSGCKAEWKDGFVSLPVGETASFILSSR